MDYATFLCPSSADALRAFECVLQRFFQCCLGIRERQSRIPRLLLMFKIDTLGIRQRTTASAFVGRLMSILDDDHATEQQKLQAKKTQIALNTAEAFQRIVALATKPLTEDQIMSMKQIMRERISRTVFTLLGELENVFRAIEDVIAFAKCAFDIRHHKGTHPRIGILDVIPFVPIKNINKGELMVQVRDFCSKVGSDHGLPILYYGDLSNQLRQKTLNQLRRKSLAETLGKTLTPDCGPHVSHATLGASCVTVRDFMLAYNINLKTKELLASKKLAQHLLELRRRGQTIIDLSQVKFLAWYVEEYGCCQISTNIYNIDDITMLELYDFVEVQAKAFNIELGGSELIGMAPWHGITREVQNRKSALEKLKLSSVRPFQKEKQVLDYFL